MGSNLNKKLISRGFNKVQGVRNIPKVLSVLVFIMHLRVILSPAISLEEGLTNH